MELCRLRVEHLDRRPRGPADPPGQGAERTASCRWGTALSPGSIATCCAGPAAPGGAAGRSASLFLNDHGRPCTGKRLSQLCGDYVKAAGVGKVGACHIFRHTMATHMLEGGADTRFIQQMLGHAHLSTTQVYTRVSIRKLQEVHRRTHPARLHREGEADATDAERRHRRRGSDGRARRGR